VAQLRAARPRRAARPQLLHGPPGSEIGTGGYTQPDQGDGQRLWNLAARIPEPERYSRIHRGRRELIDHILASHQITHAVADGDVTTGPAPTSIGDNPNARRDAPGSDHRPIVATINLPALAETLKHKLAAAERGSGKEEDPT
jgi:hypothetical protein